MTMRTLKRAVRALTAMAVLAAPAFAGAPAAQQQPPVIADKAQAKSARPTLEVVFVLDTTSSMGGLIEGAKQKIWSIASRMASGTPTPRIRVGLVAYRDSGDAYVTKKFDLSEDLDAIYKDLRGLEAVGGGDMPEHVGKGIAEAVTGMSWSQDPHAAKMMFVVGDAPSQHYGDGFDAEVWTKKAINRGIVVNTIRCGSDGSTSAEFTKLASLADGTFVSIDQSGGMLATATPFDADIGKLNGALAEKTIVAGSEGARETTRVVVAEAAAMAPSVVADRVSYKTRAEGKAAKLAPAAPMAAGAVDLEDASKLAGVKEADLPAAMRAMKPAEREAFVTKNAAEKAELQEKLVTLAKQREEWISKNATAKADSFDETVFTAVKKQAAKVNVTYK